MKCSPICFTITLAIFVLGVAIIWDRYRKRSSALKDMTPLLPSAYCGLVGKDTATNQVNYICPEGLNWDTPRNCWLCSDVTNGVVTIEPSLSLSATNQVSNISVGPGGQLTYNGMGLSYNSTTGLFTPSSNGDVTLQGIGIGIPGQVDMV